MGNQPNQCDAQQDKDCCDQGKTQGWKPDGARSKQDAVENQKQTNSEKPQSGNPIEAPGRRGVENEPDKSKAYGPGGGHIEDADKARRSTAEHADSTMKDRRTAAGADTEPL